MKIERRQPETLQAGSPQILQHRAGFGRAIPSGRFQQTLARMLRHVRCKPTGGIQLLHPPNQFVQGQRLDTVHQRNLQHLAPADVPIPDPRQHRVGFERRALGKRGAQIGIGDSTGSKQLAKFRFRQIGVNSGQSLGGGQRFLER